VNLYYCLVLFVLCLEFSLSGVPDADLEKKVSGKIFMQRTPASSNLNYDTIAIASADMPVDELGRGLRPLL
jgi:hypothetical protein